MKNRVFKVLMCLILCVAAMAWNCLTISAEEKLSVNGTQVNKGDTVTYEYYLSGVKDKIEAAGALIFYDPSCLEYIEGSIGFEAFNNAMFNFDTQGGTIYYSAINVINGYDFSEERLAVSLSFKVLDSAKGETTVTHKFDEIFTFVDEENDLTPEQYVDREKIEINAYDGTNKAPYLGTDADQMASFVQTTSVTIDDMLSGNPNPTVSNGTSSVSSEVSPAASNQSDDGLVDSDVRDEDSISADIHSSSDSNSSAPTDGNNGLVIAIAAICILLALIVAVVMIKRHNSKK